MKLNITRKIIIAAASSLAMASYVTAAPGGGGHGFGGGMGGLGGMGHGMGGGSFGSHSMGSGNSGFGHMQGDATTRTTGRGNNAYGKAQSADAHSDSLTDADADTDAKEPKLAKVKKAKNASSRGNSAFGHRQGDPATRTRGSQNNAYGKARSAEAHSDALTDTDANIDTEGKSKLAKVKKAKHVTERGNSAFGHRQGDPVTRTRGSQNNAYGKARSANVKHTTTVSWMGRLKRFLRGPR